MISSQDKSKLTTNEKAVLVALAVYHDKIMLEKYNQYMKVLKS